MGYRFKVHHGMKEPFEELAAIRASITSACKQYADAWLDVRKTENPEMIARYNKRIEEADAIMYESRKESDPTAKRMRNVIASVEQLCEGDIRAV